MSWLNIYFPQQTISSTRTKQCSCLLVVFVFVWSMWWVEQWFSEIYIHILISEICDCYLILKESLQCLYIKLGS